MNGMHAKRFSRQGLHRCESVRSLVTPVLLGNIELSNETKWTQWKVLGTVYKILKNDAYI